MPGRKRSEIQAQTGQGSSVDKSKGKGAGVATPIGKEYRQTFCPFCGVAHGPKRMGKPSGGYYEPVPTINYYEWLKLKEEELQIGDSPPYGVIQQVGLGKGHSFAFSGHFLPEEDQDGTFPLMKERLLLVIARWVKRGWVTAEEVTGTLQQVSGDIKPKRRAGAGKSR